MDDFDGGLGTLLPVARETVQDRIYRQLRDMLIRCGFDAGEAFVVADLSQRMGVSSMPVREALARLVSERALEAAPNRRISVPALTLDGARDLARARTLLEQDMMQRAMAHLTRADFATLDALTGEYETAQGARDHAHLNHAFHFHIYHRAGSPVLLPFVESLWMQAGPYVRAAARLHSPSSDRSATLHHRGILDALRRGDGPAAAAELTADIGQTFAILERAPQSLWQQDAA